MVVEHVTTLLNIEISYFYNALSQANAGSREGFIAEFCLPLQAVCHLLCGGYLLQLPPPVQFLNEACRGAPIFLDLYKKLQKDPRT